MFNYPSTPTDLNDIPYPSNNDVQVFIGPISSSAAGSEWKIWNKPKGSTMTYMIAIGGGAGGGGGGQGVSGNQKGGGGGGGSSGITTLLIPSFFLPDILYVSAGSGGEGKPLRTVTAVGPAGGTGNISYVAFSIGLTGGSPSAPAGANILLQSNAVAAAGGTTGGNGGGQGLGGAAATINTAPTTVGTLGLFASIAGQAGTNGGTATTSGTNLSAWSTIPLSSGAGGAGANAAGATLVGGNITATNATLFQKVNWAAAGTIASSGSFTGQRNGSAGVKLWDPFITSGGAGAGSDGTTGGNGADGGIGSGGGGGSAAITTAGNGGNGGPGMVMIVSW